MGFIMLENKAGSGSVLVLAKFGGAVDSVLPLGCYKLFVSKIGMARGGRGAEGRGGIIQVFPRFVPEGITKFDWKNMVTAYGITLK